jgi:hypothetical protein
MAEGRQGLRGYGSVPGADHSARLTPCPDTNQSKSEMGRRAESGLHSLDCADQSRYPDAFAVCCA